MASGQDKVKYTQTFNLPYSLKKLEILSVPSPKEYKIVSVVDFREVNDITKHNKKTYKTLHFPDKCVKSLGIVV